MAKLPAKAAKSRRHYEHNGQRLKGVTSIMGAHLGWKTQALIGWAFKLGKEGRALSERDDAAALGSCVHAMVAAELGGEPVDESEWASSHLVAGRPNAARVVDLIREMGWSILAVEVAISAETFGGTIDLVVRDADGDVLIVDLKTGKGAYREMAVQLGAYAWLWRIRCTRENAVGDFATEGRIIHAYPGEPVKLWKVGPKALAAGEQIFRKLLDIEECCEHVELSE